VNGERTYDWTDILWNKIILEHIFFLNINAQIYKYFSGKNSLIKITIFVFKIVKIKVYFGLLKTTLIFGKKK